jgi:hypothetical protein
MNIFYIEHSNSGIGRLLDRRHIYRKWGRNSLGFHVNAKFETAWPSVPSLSLLRGEISGPPERQACEGEHSDTFSCPSISDVPEKSDPRSSILDHAHDGD